MQHGLLALTSPDHWLVNMQFVVIVAGKFSVKLFTPTICTQNNTDMRPRTLETH